MGGEVNQGAIDFRRGLISGLFASIMGMYAAREVKKRKEPEL
jgi:hypothetical protein